jgi:hypothetical protein
MIDLNPLGPLSGCRCRPSGCRNVLHKSTPRSLLAAPPPPRERGWNGRGGENGKSHCILINSNNSTSSERRERKSSKPIYHFAAMSRGASSATSIHHLVKSYDYEIIYRAHSAAPCFCSANLCLPIVMLCGSGRVKFVLT